MQGKYSDRNILLHKEIKYKVTEYLSNFQLASDRPANHNSRFRYVLRS